VSAFVSRKIYQPGDKVLFLCHDNYILEQAHAEYKMTFAKDKRIFFYNFFGRKKDVEEAKRCDIVFASFQSFNNQKSKWYLQFEENHFDIIIVDEGHHSQAFTFREVINYFKPSFGLCMTGTPNRMDKLDIRNLYGEEVVSISIEEGIAKGWLSPV